MRGDGRGKERSKRIPRQFSNFVENTKKICKKIKENIWQIYQMFSRKKKKKNTTNFRLHSFLSFFFGFFSWNSFKYKNLQQNKTERFVGESIACGQCF